MHCHNTKHLLSNTNSNQIKNLLWAKIRSTFMGINIRAFKCEMLLQHRMGKTNTETNQEKITKNGI